MISFLLFNVCVVTFIYFIYNYVFYRPKNFPPGPPKIPWFGSYIFMLMLNRHHLHKAITKICKFYNSNIIGLYLGDTPVIVLNDNEKVKLALNHRDFDGRPDILMGRLRDRNLNLFGIFFTDGDVWHEQRRFTLRYLRDYGFGRRFDSLEKEIQIEIAQHIDMLKNGPKYAHEQKFVRDGKVLLPIGFAPPFANCFVGSVLLNENIPRKEMEKLHDASEAALIFQRKTDDFGKLYSLIPMVAKWFPDKSDYNSARDSSIHLYDYFKELIDEQIRTYDASHERHFIDMYINNMHKAANDPDEETYFSYDQLILTCIDFSFPALSALSTTVTFLVQQVCIEPQIQKKIQEEIDQVVGEGRAPTLDDRNNMPYTEACIREIMRFETLVPSGLPHKALNDTEFLGYKIPKGAFIITGLDASSRDNAAWEFPHKFRPERFLDYSGKLCLRKDVSVPFGAGKRLCAGETFARNMLFLFTSALFQAFSVSLPKGDKVHSFDDNLTGMIRTTPDHWIQLTAR